MYGVSRSVTLSATIGWWAHYSWTAGICSPKLSMHLKHVCLNTIVKLHNIGLAQPGLPGGAFGASPQGPGKEVMQETGLTSYQLCWDYVCKNRLTGGKAQDWLTVWLCGWTSRHLYMTCSDSCLCWLIVTHWTLTHFVYDSIWLLLTRSDSYYRCVLGSLRVGGSVYPK